MGKLFRFALVQIKTLKYQTVNNQPTHTNTHTMKTIEYKWKAAIDALKNKEIAAIRYGGAFQNYYRITFVRGKFFTCSIDGNDTVSDETPSFPDCLFLQEASA